MAAVCAVKRGPNTWRGLLSMTWPRLLVFLLFVDSFLYLFTSAVLLFGVVLETNLNACMAATNMCIIFYGSTKVIIYVFLGRSPPPFLTATNVVLSLFRVERVHLVWSPTASSGGRLRSKVWLLCMGLNVGYIVILVLMFVGIVHYWDEHGRCIIGLKPFADYALRHHHYSQRSFPLPTRNLQFSQPEAEDFGDAHYHRVYYCSHYIQPNCLYLALVNGRELGFVCFGTCGIDLTINSLTMFFVTGGADNVDFSEIEISRGGNTGTNDRSGNRVDGTSANKVFSFKLGSTSVRKMEGDEHPLQVMVHTRTSVDVDKDKDGESSISKGKADD
ncbi:hypothetical protein V5O48_003410 [Marasmius crinis-equi]|uniref:Uncharacterized protein n=1 Tax=Marasmius crinis-equi TaxID=585013 RepID=A0ABR3FTB0_9AGAR